MASLIRNAEAAPAVVQLVLLPLVFISGTYTPIHSDLLNRITAALPVRPFNHALPGPFAQHTGFDWKPHRPTRLGHAGAVIAIRRFRWNPDPNERRTRGFGTISKPCQKCAMGPHKPHAHPLTARTAAPPIPLPSTPSTAFFALRALADTGEGDWMLDSRIRWHCPFRRRFGTPRA